MYLSRMYSKVFGCHLKYQLFSPADHIDPVAHDVLMCCNSLIPVKKQKRSTCSQTYVHQGSEISGEYCRHQWGNSPTQTRVPEILFDGYLWSCSAFLVTILAKQPRRGYTSYSRLGRPILIWYTFHF